MHEQTSSRLSLPCQREESGHKTSPVYSAEQSMTPLNLDFEIAKEACKFRPAQFRPPQAGSSTRSSTHSFEWGCLGAFWGPWLCGPQVPGGPALSRSFLSHSHSGLGSWGASCVVLFACGSGLMKSAAVQVPYTSALSASWDFRRQRRREVCGRGLTKAT